MKSELCLNLFPSPRCGEMKRGVLWIIKLKVAVVVRRGSSQCKLTVCLEQDCSDVNVI